MSGSSQALPSPAPVRVREIPVGAGELVLIAGPCVIESEEHTLRTAEKLARIAAEAGLPWIFKSSYDKANRSSLAGFRGPGLEAGLRVLERVRAETGAPVLSDVHTPAEAETAAAVLDVLQVPAFLCRQTDLLLAAGRSGKPVNVKKGQFMAPWDMRNVVEKLQSTGNRRVLLTERGTCFGYNNLVSDMRGLPLMRALGVPVVFDATHSVQLPGGRGDRSDGERDMARVLARAAVAAGVDAVFLEVHEDPDRAPCDGPNMIPLAQLPPLLAVLQALHRVARAADA